MRKQVGNISFWFENNASEIKKTCEDKDISGNILNLNLWYLDNRTTLDVGVMFKPTNYKSIVILFPQEIGIKDVIDLSEVCRNNNLSHLIFNEPCGTIASDINRNYFDVTTSMRNIRFLKSNITIEDSRDYTDKKGYTVLKVSFNEAYDKDSHDNKNFNYIRIRINNQSRKPPVYIYSSNSPSVLSGLLHKTYCVDLRVNDIRSEFHIKENMLSYPRIIFSHTHLIIANQSSHELVTQTAANITIRVSEPGWEEYQPDIRSSTPYLVYHIKEIKTTNDKSPPVIFFAKFQILEYNGLMISIVTIIFLILVNLSSNILGSFLLSPSPPTVKHWLPALILICIILIMPIFRGIGKLWHYIRRKICEKL